MLKYTGYGNAAGLLAARGLLAGGRGDHWYSDDEDTDTEEYKSAKPKYSIVLNSAYSFAIEMFRSIFPPFAESPVMKLHVLT